MTVNLSLFAGAGAQFFDNNGLPLNGGLLYSYAAGTSTQAATYTSNSGSIANSNPIVLDSAGRVPNEIWLTQGSTYKFVLQTSVGVQIGSWDNIPGANDQTSINAVSAALTAFETSLASSTGSSLIGYNEGSTGAVTTTVQAKLQQTISVQDFGAKGDGVTDDTAAVQAAIVACIANNSILTGEGTFKLTSTVNFRNVCVNMPNATFKVAQSGLGVYIGGNSANTNNPPQCFGAIIRSVGTDAYSTPTIRMIGASCQDIYVGYTGYIQLYADTSTSENGQSYAIQYSNITIINCTTLELTNNASTTGNPAQQYINENCFTLSAIQNLLINGTYGHNHNTFNQGSFEGNANINMQVGGSNYVNNIRNEGLLTVNFASGVQDCIITIGWVSSGDRYPNYANLSITNNGAMCGVQHLYDLYAPLIPIVGFSYQNLIKVSANYNVIGASNITINSTNLSVPSFTTFYQSGLIPVNGDTNAIFELNIYNASGGIRTVVTGYDSTKTAITPASNQVTFDGYGNVAFGQSSNTSNAIQADRFFVLPTNCAFIQITVNSAGTATTFDSFYLGVRAADTQLRKKIDSYTFTTNNLY